MKLLFKWSITGYFVIGKGEQPTPKPRPKHPVKFDYVQALVVDELPIFAFLQAH